MNLATAAMLVLLNGSDLNGWVSLSGQWTCLDGVMVCRAAPASIRTSWESDVFEMSFQYRRSAPGSRVAIHSRMLTGGRSLMLTPGGILAGDSEEGYKPLTGGQALTFRSGDTRVLEDEGNSIGSDAWITARITVTDKESCVRCFRADGSPLSEMRGVLPPDRGFLRFETMAPGLEVRDIRVTEPGFLPMFDGETLDGWEAVRPRDPDDPGWFIDNGVLRCRGHSSSWLRTWRTYQDFELRLEYQLPPKGNSGIFLRAPIEGRVSRNGLEIQLVDDVAYRGQIKPCCHTGSIYDGIAPEVQVPAPVNEWNAIEIRLEGRRIRTTLNGIRLYDALLDDLGIDWNRDKRPLSTRRSVGFIGLQDHSTVVRFRNVRIRDLDLEK